MAASPTALSPRYLSERHLTAIDGKKHHVRRKSGNHQVIASDKKSSTRSAATPRKSAQHSGKVGSSFGAGSKHTSRDRHRDRDREGEVDRSRDSGESFPQFCMTCEKQFLPARSTFLYCSEACRLHDHATSYSSRSHSYSTPVSPPQSPYTRPFSSLPGGYTFEDGPDIVPPFSPTQSRPRSYLNSESYGTSYQLNSTGTYESSPMMRAHSGGPSSALASLRELATVLPRTTSSRAGSGIDNEDGSPPKSTSITRSGSAVWNYMPFGGSKTNTPFTTPGNSYTNTYGYNASLSYGGHGQQASVKTPRGEYATSKTYGLGISESTLGAVSYSNAGGFAMDRPLPPRSGPGNYGHRPKSIDLVTPYTVGY